MWVKAGAGMPLLPPVEGRTKSGPIVWCVKLPWQQRRELFIPPSTTNPLPTPLVWGYVVAKLWVAFIKLA